MNTSQKIALFAVIVTIIGITIAETSKYCDRANESYIASLKHDIDMYEKFEKFNIPKTLNTLNTTLTELEKNAKNINDYTDTINKNKELEIKNKTLSSDIEKFKQENIELNKKIEALEEKYNRLMSENENFTLKNNQSRTLLGGEIAVGLSRASQALEIATVTINNKTHELRAGQSVSLELSGKRCTTVLKGIGYDSAGFEFFCKPIPPKSHQ
ncbi:hypothetical protein [Desulfovibrio subterraneus]|uniref:Uncharacterized protein n=1 Tax=Desulfovibrio subterraneus TaxID=2718620 RepID=A0A7J0BKG1_9BACT|nr:hypothetical protein [Desulfovibrio subterraneus]GFM34068.1 hypothetical protein DSM101010T_24330 [Desulfovibrio subterraneus]